MAKSVEKALRESELGLNPASDGQLIRIPIPPLSEERRKELVKIAGKYAEQGKVAVRNVRRDALDGIKKLKKDNEISEDEEKRYENEIQKLTDETIKRWKRLLLLKKRTSCRYKNVLQSIRSDFSGANIQELRHCGIFLSRKSIQISL